MSVATRPKDWGDLFSERTRAAGGDQITAILAQTAAGKVITFSGGFPDPATFPTDVLAGIAADVIRHDGATALQYAPTQGLPALREYLADRIAGTDGARPDSDRLMVTSGGMDCLGLVAKAALNPGDAVAAEAPTYLGALMAFRGYQANLQPVPMDTDGLDTDALAEQLAGGARPKLLYTIPDHQNPTGLTMTAHRRQQLVDLADRYGFLILEDVAYRELGFDGSRLPSLWSLAPDRVLQIGTFSKTFFPGARLGWAAGPADVIAQLCTAKQTGDQCSGALGQAILQQYGQGGHMDRQLVASRRLYAHRCDLMVTALGRHMPAGVSWTTPSGGFFTWVTLPASLDAVTLAGPARAAGVSYVPGAPFHIGPAGTNQLRLSYSRVDDALIDDGIHRLAAVIHTALEEQ